MNSTARTVSFRRMTATVLLLLPTAVLAGCVVDPRPDYERAAAIIRDHTGASETYLPGGDEAAIRSAVAAMLADGLTVDEAVRIAMLNNPRLQALFCDVGVSRAEVVQAGLPPNPTFSFTEGFPQGGGMPSLTFSASQSLIELLLIPIRKKIAESQLQQSQLAVAQQAVELVGDVKRACYLLISL